MTVGDKRLECRITISHLPGGMFKLGMFDPVASRHEPLGTHPEAKIERIVGDLRARMERERHVVTFTEWWTPR